MSQDESKVQQSSSDKSTGNVITPLRSCANNTYFDVSPRSTASSTNTLGFSCTWTGCSNKTFRRKSDLKKHWDKHTKPYVCDEPRCNGFAFGDKAGLRRHETEKHGKPDAIRYFCPVNSCPRSQKSFPRKSNRDLHVETRHGGSFSVRSDMPGNAKPSTASELAQSGTEQLRFEGGSLGGNDHILEKVPILKAKLEELERERKELASNMKVLNSRLDSVDEDIQTVKRTMQLVAE